MSELNTQNQTTHRITQHVFLFLAIEMRNTKIYMNKPVYLGLLVSELSKIVMYEFWCNYIK